ncbi:MAG: DUF6883 domain-containing protein [Rhizomicrobium sp.]
MRLPNGDQASLDIRKLEDCCLDPDHPRGKHKARVFRDALGLSRKDANWLRQALLAAADGDSATQFGTDDFGTRWRIDTSLARQDRVVVIRSLWIVRTGEQNPRFVTCWVL